MKEALFLQFFLRSLFDNLESGKSLEFWIQNLYEPCIIHSAQGFSGIIYQIVWGTFASETGNAVYK